MGCLFSIFQDDDEDDDPKIKSVASVVRIKPRTTLPPEARPSKFLLLKAINEAQKSISTSRARSMDVEEEEEDPRPKVSSHFFHFRFLKNDIPVALHQELEEPSWWNGENTNNSAQFASSQTSV
jgi:hypothetical protein